MSAAEHEAAIGRLLAELGDTADKVADTLRAKGIKGRRRDGCSCPIANLLAAAGYEGTDVGEDWIALDDYVNIDTPPPIGAFVGRFDSGVYLDLVEVAG